MNDTFLLQEASITLCTAQRSPQQVLYQLYNAITMTELKGYAMMQFSYMLLKTYGRGEIFFILLYYFLHCMEKTKDINDRSKDFRYDDDVDEIIFTHTQLIYIL